MDDPTDIVAAIKEFTNINKNDTVSALNGFFLMRKMTTEIFVLTSNISRKFCLK